MQFLLREILETIQHNLRKTVPAAINPLPAELALPSPSSGPFLPLTSSSGHHATDKEAQAVDRKSEKIMGF